MEPFRFRPRLTGLEARETPAASPAEVFAAMDQARFSQAFLEDFTEARNEGVALDIFQVEFFEQLLPALARQNTAAAKVLGDYRLELQNNLLSNPSQAVFVLPLIDSVRHAEVTAHINAGWAIKHGTDFGVPFPDGNIPLPPPPTPVPPAPEEQPPGTSPGPSVTNPPTDGDDDVTVTNPGGTPTTPTTPSRSDGLSATMPPLNAAEWQTQPNGLRIWDTVVGTGAAVPDPTNQSVRVTVEYTGWKAADGQKFDSSLDRPQPAQFNLDGVIEGFRQGFIGMRVGGIRRIFIPSELGYGTAGNPGAGIPPNADLVFEVKLISVP